MPLPPTCPPPASHSEPSLQADAKYPSWESIYAELSGKYGTRTVTPEEAFDMAQLGNAVVIDVRPKEDFDKARGAVGVTECRLSGNKKLKIRVCLGASVTSRAVRQLPEHVVQTAF